MEMILDHVSKSYGKREVLHQITMTIPTGLCGLLGRNGAGKTSLMRILATLQTPTAGSVMINGIPLKETGRVRAIIGYLPQDFMIYKSMTVYGVLDYLGLLSGLEAQVRRKRITQLLDQVNLAEQAHKKVGALSGGMRQRLGIAQALLHEPQLLIVDEPTAGLDPEERIRFRELLKEFARERIVLFSTHIASDIEAVCERVAVLDEGRLLYYGSTAKLETQGEMDTDRRKAGEIATDKMDQKTRIQARVAMTSRLEAGYLSLLRGEEGGSL